MNRNYDLDDIKGKIQELRSLSKDIFIYTHIIINFPTETDDDFVASLKISKIFDDVLIMNYSDNE